MKLLRHHFIVCLVILSTLGIFPFCRELTVLTSSFIFSQFPVIVYNHVLPFFYPDKKIELVSYLLCLVVTTIYSFSIGRLARNSISGEDEATSVHKVLLVLSTICNGLPWLVKTKATLILWPVMAGCPILYYTESRRWFSNLRGQSWNIWALSMLALSVMLIPLVIERPYIRDEYYGISTETKLGKSAQPVDTISHGNADPYLGFYRYNAGKPLDQPPVSTPSVPLAMTDALRSLLQETQEYSSLKLIAEARGVPLKSLLKNEDELPDDPQDHGREIAVFSHGRLYATDIISSDFESKIAEAVENKDRQNVHELAEQSKEFFGDKKNHSYSSEEKEFIQSNYQEVTDGIMARRILHHQNFLLGSIQELNKGRNPNDINFQYGYLPILLIQKILNYFNDISFQAYYRILNSFFIIYLISSLFIGRSILKNWPLAVGYFGISIAVLGFIGYDVIATAPGMNPIRHILDLGVIAFCGLALRRRSEILLLPVYAFCIVAIYINSQSGLALSLSIAMSMAIISMTDEKGRKRLAVVPLTLIPLFVSLAFFAQPGKNELSFYYFEGLLGFPIHAGVVLAFVMLCCIGYATLFRFWGTISRDDKGFLLIFIFYSQLMFLYYIWGGSKYHLLNYLSIYIFLLIFIIKIWVENDGKISYFSLRFRNIASLAICGLIVIGSGHFLYQKYSYFSTFSTHVTYDWTSERARIVSTMPEKPFSEASRIINKYAQDPGIFIISEYDNFLPFYADKYSCMPYPDLQWFINSQQEKDEVIRSLKETVPKYLFVDKTLDRDLGFEIVSADTPLIGTLQAESILRTQRIRVLQEIFDSIKAEYQQVDEGGIIQVWRHNDENSHSNLSGGIR